MSVKLFKKEVDDYLLKYNKGLKETNLSGIIMADVNDIANKHGFIVEVEDPDHISYNETKRKNLRIADVTDKEIGGLALNVYRNNSGTYEYNTYLSISPSKKSKLKP